VRLPVLEVLLPRCNLVPAFLCFDLASFLGGHICLTVAVDVNHVIQQVVVNLGFGVFLDIVNMRLPFLEFPLPRRNLVFALLYLDLASFLSCHVRHTIAIDIDHVVQQIVVDLGLRVRLDVVNVRLPVLELLLPCCNLVPAFLCLYLASFLCRHVRNTIAIDVYHVVQQVIVNLSLRVRLDVINLRLSVLELLIARRNLIFARLCLLLADFRSALVSNTVAIYVDHVVQHIVVNLSLDIL